MGNRQRVRPPAMEPEQLLNISRAQYEAIKGHLCSQYQGVFSETEVERHIRNYVGLELAGQQVF